MFVKSLIPVLALTLAAGAASAAVSSHTPERPDTFRPAALSQGAVYDNFAAPAVVVGAPVIHHHH